MLHILQSDNGAEFKSKLFVNSIASWEGNCKIVYGRPRHPQSQGLVEQANGTVEKMLMALMKQLNTKEWARLLPLLMFNLNTSTSSTTKFMPFEVTFNMKPNFGSAKSFVEVNEKNVETSVSDAPCCSSKISDLMVIEETDEETEKSPSDDEPNPMLERQKAADAMREQLNQNKLSNAEKLIKKHDCKRNKKKKFF